VGLTASPEGNQKQSHAGRALSSPLGEKNARTSHAQTFRPCAFAHRQRANGGQRAGGSEGGRGAILNRRRRRTAGGQDFKSQPEALADPLIRWRRCQRGGRPRPQIHACTYEGNREVNYGSYQSPVASSGTTTGARQKASKTVQDRSTRFKVFPHLSARLFVRHTISLVV
jgi:hypothetical protein